MFYFAMKLFCETTPFDLELEVSSTGAPRQASFGFKFRYAQVAPPYHSTMLVLRRRFGHTLKDKSTSLNCFRLSVLSWSTGDAIASGRTKSGSRFAIEADTKNGDGPHRRKVSITTVNSFISAIMY